MNDFKSSSLGRRRWFQFRLRTLLILVLIASLPLGLFNASIEPKRRQRRAADAIAGAGGSVWYVGSPMMKTAPSYPPPSRPAAA